MNVVVIGAGNVATHLSKIFLSAGHQISQVWGRGSAGVAELARQVGAQVITKRQELNEQAELYLIAVKDHAIAEVAAQLIDLDGIVVHTSGATGIEVLSACKHYGVLYPLQTFSRDQELNTTEVPFFLEAASESTSMVLENLAFTLSKRVDHISSEERRILHLSAAFACNFVNQLYTLSANLVEHYGLDFDMLRPLIMETALKVQGNSPAEVQTGPARRGDHQTMEAHLELLKDQADLAVIYRTLSESIKKTHS